MDDHLLDLIAEQKIREWGDESLEIPIELHGPVTIIDVSACKIPWRPEKVNTHGSL